MSPPVNEQEGRIPLRIRVLAVTATIVLAGSIAVGLVGQSGREQTQSPGATPRPSLSPTPSAPAFDPIDILTDPAVAANVGASAVLDAGYLVATGAWSDLRPPGWPVQAALPVYIVAADIGPDGRGIEADVVVATHTDGSDELSMRLLPAAEELGETGLEISVEVDGNVVDVAVDPAEALLRIPLTIGAEAPVLVRIRVHYDLPAAETLSGGGAVGYGLLTRTPDVSVLGHWLPLLTFDDAPLVAWGDVGAFPVAIWSAEIRHPGTLVTGGEDGPCQQPAEGCTWARGTALRDLSAVVIDDAEVFETTAGEHVVRAVASSRVAAHGAEVLAETAAATRIFAEQLGDLAWREVDVVAAPLSRSAAGMEFPGLIVVRDDLWGATGGAFGTYVIAHEIAHQWFHALVGNSSLADPVVDESIAQYLSVVYFAEDVGAEAADDLVRTSMEGRYLTARRQGLQDGPPARSLHEFGNSAYGPLVYARAPLGFVAAERVLGMDRVVAFLAELVRDHGLREVTADDVLAAADRFDERLAAELRRAWTDPRPYG